MSCRLGCSQFCIGEAPKRPAAIAIPLVGLVATNSRIARSALPELLVEKIWSMWVDGFSGDELRRLMAVVAKNDVHGQSPEPDEDELSHEEDDELSLEDELLESDDELPESQPPLAPAPENSPPPPE